MLNELITFIRANVWGVVKDNPFYAILLALIVAVIIHATSDNHHETNVLICQSVLADEHIYVKRETCDTLLEALLK